MPDSAKAGSQPAQESEVALSLRSGLGGQAAGAFAGQLLGMYRALAAQRGWMLVIEATEGDETTGYESAQLRVRGAWAWPLLRGEHGQHRWIGSLPGDAAQRPHMASCTVQCVQIVAGELSVVDTEPRASACRRNYHELHQTVTDDRLPGQSFVFAEVMAGRCEALLQFAAP